MINNKPTTNSKKSHIYIYIYILIVFYLIAIFLPFVSRNSASNTANTNNTSQTDTKSGLGTQVVNTKKVYFTQNQGAGQTAQSYLPDGNSSFYFGRTGTALTTANFSTGPSAADVAGTNGNVQGYCGWWSTAPTMPEGLSGSGNLGSSAFSSTACTFTSNSLATRATNLLNLMNSSTKSLSTPYLSINPSASTVGVYTVTLEIRFMYQWNSSSNVRLSSPSDSGGLLGSNWDSASLNPATTPTTYGPYIRIQFPMEIHILPTGSKGSYINRTRSATGIYGTTEHSNFSNVQAIDSSENSYANWSFITNPNSAYFAFSGSTTNTKDSAISWPATTPPGTYTLKIKAQSVSYSVDQPELEFDIVIKYAPPFEVVFPQDQQTTWNFKEVSGTAQAPNETGNISPLARDSDGVSTYILQSFTWAISNFKKDGSTATKPDWMVQNTTATTCDFSMIIPQDALGTYTFTLKATTTDNTYSLKNKTIDLTINVVPNVSTLVVQNIETTIIGKSHAAGAATADQKFVAETAPYTYTISPTWTFNSIKKDGETFDNSTNIFTIPNGLLTWTAGVVYGEYEITVKAAYSNVSTTADCTVQIDRPEATWKTPAITYAGKVEYWGSTNFDGSSYTNFIHKFNEDDALPPTWEIRTEAGVVIENNLLYIGPSGTLNWKQGLATGNYTFYVTATTTTNITPTTKAWKDPADQSGLTYTPIVLHEVSGNVDDVSLTTESAAAITDITNIRTSQIGTSSYSLQGQVTHLDGSAITRNFTPSLIASGTSGSVPSWLDVTTPDANGTFKISWNGAVKGEYTVKVYLFAENIDGHDYGYQSVDIKIVVTDFPPNSITITTPNSPFASQVNTSGISTQTVSAECLSATGSADYINQSVTWSVSNIKNPAGNDPAEEPTITVLPDNTISWTALPIVGNWTFSLKATSTVNSVNKTVNNVTIAVSPVAPDFFFIDSSSMLADNSNLKNIEYGQSFQSDAPTLTAQYQSHSDWSDNTLWTPTYSLVMEQGAATPSGLTIDTTNGKFSVAATTAIGTYYFHIHVVMTLNSDQSQLYNPLDTYVFTLNVNEITPDACAFTSQVTKTSLLGYKGWSGETDTSSSWTDGKFAASATADGSPANVNQSIDYSIVMTNSSGVANSESVPTWLAIGPSGEIEWDQPSTDGTYFFRVVAHPASFPNVTATSTNFYTLTISPGTTPEAVQINNEETIDDILSNVVATKSKAGQIDTAVLAQAFGEVIDGTPDIYVQKGIIYSLTGSNIPSWLHIDSESGVISWDADWEEGTYDFYIRATSVADESIYDECGTTLNISTNDTSSSTTRTIIYIAAASIALVAVIAATTVLTIKHRHTVRRVKK